jgi:hypothetical protein
MQTLNEKKPYEKPVLEVCGPMVEQTLCEDEWDGSSGVGFKPDTNPGFGWGHNRNHHRGWWPW